MSHARHALEWCREATQRGLAIILAIIFDFNGVIADDETPHLHYFQQALAEHGKQRAGCSPLSRSGTLSSGSFTLRSRWQEGQEAWRLLYLVELPIPLHETGNPHLDRCGWLKSDTPRQVFDIGIRRRHITGLNRQQLLLRLFPDRLFQYLDKTQQLNRLMIADIVDPGRAELVPGSGLSPDQAGFGLVGWSRVLITPSTMSST